MGTLQAVYDRAPIFLQNLMCSVAGRQKYRERYGEVYRRTRKFCKEFDGWTEEQQLAYQEEELQRFLRFAYEKSPFYHELYRDINLDAIRTVQNRK